MNGRMAWLMFIVVWEGVSTDCQAQMEKRSLHLYDSRAFATANPAIGEALPDVALCDLDGRSTALSQFRGQTLVVLVGGFT